MNSQQLDNAIQALCAGEVIAYPTEAVFGLGCDPDNHSALLQLLALKQRAASKGVILIASEFSQLQPYLARVDDKLLQRALATWPGPYTWLIPCATHVDPLLIGEHNTIAVRVTAHPIASALCRAFGKPIVSTSANLSGHPPARSVSDVQAQFGNRIATIVDGEVDLNAKPSEIRDLISNSVIRSGK